MFNASGLNIPWISFILHSCGWPKCWHHVTDKLRIPHKFSVYRKENINLSNKYSYCNVVKRLAFGFFEDSFDQYIFFFSKHYAYCKTNVMYICENVFSDVLNKSFTWIWNCLYDFILGKNMQFGFHDQDTADRKSISNGTAVIDFVYFTSSAHVIRNSSAFITYVIRR